MKLLILVPVALSALDSHAMATPRVLSNVFVHSPDIYVPRVAKRFYGKQIPESPAIRFKGIVKPSFKLGARPHNRFEWFIPEDFFVPIPDEDEYVLSSQVHNNPPLWGDDPALEGHFALQYRPVRPIHVFFR